MQAASGQIGCLAAWPCNLQQCELGSLTAWMRNSCSLAAGLLDCLARGFTISAAWKLDSVALQQFVAWLLGRVNNCRAGNPKTCNHHWTRPQLAHTLYHSKGLDQRSGSFVDRGLIQTLHFEPQPYRHLDVEFTPMLPRHMSMIGPSTAALSSLLPSSIFCKYARIFSCKMRQYPLAKCNLKNIPEFTIPHVLSP